MNDERVRDQTKREDSNRNRYFTARLREIQRDDIVFLSPGLPRRLGRPCPAACVSRCWADSSASGTPAAWNAAAPCRARSAAHAHAADRVDVQRARRRREERAHQPMHLPCIGPPACTCRPWLRTSRAAAKHVRISRTATGEHARAASSHPQALSVKSYTSGDIQ